MKMSKKKIVKAVAMLLFMVLGISACGSDTTALKSNQRYVYAYITEINGNEMTYMELDESAVEEMLGSGSESEEKEDDKEDSSKQDASKQDLAEGESSDRPGRGSRPDMGSFPEGMEMPEGMEFPEGMEMPEGMEFPEGMEMPEGMEFPEGMERPDMGNMPEGMERSDTGEMPGGLGGTNGNFVTAQIPVGATVHTAADVETTFSRLVKGDLVKILVETEEDTDVIIEIWMLQ